MWKRQWLKGRKGQSIVEYLVVAGAIVAAILVVRGTIQANANSLFNKAANKLNVNLP